MRSYRYLILILLMWIVPQVRLSAQEMPVYTIEKVALANFPAAMVFAPDGRLFYTEKVTGNVRVINTDDRTQPDPVITLPTDALVERGLLGIALDPAYVENGLIWVVHTRPGSARDWPANEIVRFHEVDGVGSEPEVMLSVPITNGELKHNGGNLHFDADGLLYVSFGDYGDAAHSQDLTTIPGKIHRFEVTDQGLQSAPDNPFADSSIYAYGLRNTFDFTIDPISGALFGSENGFHCDDEINLLLPGKNYGWGPDYRENCYGTEPLDLADYMPPLLSFTPTVAPTGIDVYNGAAFPDWQGQLFFCQWNTGTMHRALLDETRSTISETFRVDLGDAFCRTDIATSPDGLIYFAEPSGIYRLVPAPGA